MGVIGTFLRNNTANECYDVHTKSFVSSNILNSIFDDIPLIMILVNQDGKVETINRATTIALGKEKKDSFGLLGGELFGCINSLKGEGCGKNRECSECAVRNSVIHTFETGESIYKKQGELEITNNGKLLTLHFLVSTSLIRKNDKPMVSLIVDDVTKIKQANQLIEQKLEIEKVIASISSMFVSSRDIDHSINFALEKICNLCGSSRTYVFRFHDDGILMDNTHEYCVEKVEAQKDNLQDIPVDLFPWWMNKLHNGESIYIKNVSKLPEEASAEKEILEMQAIKSLIVLPLYLNSELSGFIGMDNVLNTGDWADEDINTLLMTAQIIGTSLQRKEAEKELTESKKKYSNLVEKGNDGIIILQGECLLKYANKKMMEMSGFSIEEVIGKPFIDFVSPNYRDTIMDRYKRRLCGEKVLNQYEVELISKDGKSFFVEVNASIIDYEGRSADMAILRDITKRKQVEEALQRSEENYRNLTESLNELIYRANPETLVSTYVNKAVEKIYGYTVDMWLDDPYIWEKTIYHDDRERVFAEFAELQTKIESGIIEYRIIKKDKTIRWVQDHVSWEKDQQGKPISMNGIMYDITERKQAENLMLNAKLAAEAANMSKTEFITNMSHELRTPLNSVIGFSDILYSEKFGILNEYQKKYVSNVLRNGKHLLQLINEILSISNIETGRVKLHISEFFVSDVIDEVEALMMPIALEKDIDLTCNIDISVPIIKADMMKFKQVLCNLVNNAIKFTDQGGSVTINGDISDESVNLFIKDTGIGILLEDRDKLFNPFYQVDSSTTREYGGAGLGLALVKKFVEMHGGKVWVESDQYSGSTFGFTIPSNHESISS
ncbi:PAS domain S-box protein [Methanococcoides orientis]|uniref:PAS domain S-box protein n=1 Tax=Methanococcoides orientis TaxID=2822137 RepID=UPI001E3DC98D|nr:PAS domain S-box protein [Methanococcoides orientis]UGV41604.1 PAS domain S-box protein [Methanococcoides orientis]